MTPDSLWTGSPHPPRQWQAEALPLCIEALSGPEALPCGLVVAATGTGKSHLLARVVAHHQRRVAAGEAEGLAVVACPSSMLVDQLTATLRAHLGARVVGQFDGRRKQIRSTVVTCYKSLGRLREALAEAGQAVGLLVMDEAHKTVPYVDELRALAPLSAIGCTATPYRSLDEEALALFRDVLYRIGLAEAIRLGYLCPYEVIRATPDQADQPREEVIAAMLAGVEGPGLIDATSIPDADACAEAMSSLGVPAMSIHSALSKREQARRLRLLREGELRALVDPALLTEGVDLPWLRWLALRREIGSRVALVQRCGRVLRLDEGKERAYILDPGLVIDSLGLSHKDALGEADADDPDALPLVRARWRDGALMAGEEQLGRIEEQGRRWLCWAGGSPLPARASERGAQIAVVAEARRRLLAAAEPRALVVVGMAARDQGSHPLPGARAVSEAEGWVASLVAVARGAGLVAPREPQRPAWRAEPMGWAQAAALGGAVVGRGLGCLPDEARELAQAVRARPELTRGAADDLIALGTGLAARWKQAARRHAPDWGAVGRASRWPGAVGVPRLPEGRGD